MKAFLSIVVILCFPMLTVAPAVGATPDPLPEDSTAAPVTAEAESKEGESQKTRQERKRTDFIETLLVTAERRATFFQETPLSIVAFGADDLEQMNADGIDSLQHFLPNVSIGGDFEGGDTQPLFMIRGIGQSAGRSAVERGVGLYIDDVYYPRTTATLFQMLDVERLEVLRGPQGTLFGRNTTGGAIRYMTRKPTDQFEGYVQTTGGSLGRADLQSAINVPFHDKVQGRFQVGVYKRDGYVDLTHRDDERGDMDDTVLRGMLRFLPSSNLTVDLSVTRIDTEDFGPPLHISGLDPNQFQTGAVSQQLLANGEPPLVVNDPRFVDDDRFELNGRCFQENNVLGLFDDDFDYCDKSRSQDLSTFALDLTWDTSPVTLRSLTAVIDGETNADSDWGGLGTQSFRRTATLDSLSQEVQLSGLTERVAWVGGVYYFRETPVEFDPGRFLAPFGPCCIGLDKFRDIETESLGVFGQATFDLSPKANFTGGLRYSRDDKSIDLQRSDVDNNRVFSAADEWDALDYRLTLDYRFTDDVMGYATTAKGYKSGGFNDNVDTNAPRNENSGLTSYDPETVVNYEIGLRSEWFRNQVRFNLTGFFMNYEDLILSTPIFTGGLNTTPFITLSNAGDVDLHGFEMDFAWVASRRLQFKGSLANTSHSYRSLADGSALFIVSTCSNPATPTFATCEAQDLARAPEWTYSLSGRWSLNLANRGLLRTTLTYGFTDELETNNSANNSLRLEEYEVVNLRAQYDDPHGRFSLALFGNNLADEQYDTAGANFVQFFGVIQSAPGRPREWGVDLTFHF